ASEWPGTLAQELERCGAGGSLTETSFASSSSSVISKGNVDCTQSRHKEEGRMCPACIASTAAIVAGAGCTGGILAVCIGKFGKFFRARDLSLFHKTREK